MIGDALFVKQFIYHNVRYNTIVYRDIKRMWNILCFYWYNDLWLVIFISFPRLSVEKYWSTWWLLSIVFLYEKFSFILFSLPHMESNEKEEFKNISTIKIYITSKKNIFIWSCFSFWVYFIRGTRDANSSTLTVMVCLLIGNENMN